MKNILVFCANRSDTAYLLPILAELKNQQLHFKLVVTGTHLSKKFGNTVSEFLDSGYNVDYRVTLETDENSPISKVYLVGECIRKVGLVLAESRPDCILVFGDRMEHFAAATAATYLSCPVGHIFGGDSFASFHYDATVRHSITKLSHLHFAACEEHKNRIIGLGEEHWRVYNVGSTAFDSIKNMPTASAKELNERLDIDVNKPVVLFTQHSVPGEYSNTEHQIDQSLSALLRLDKDIQIIITYPSHDAGSEIIIKKIKNIADKKNIRVVKNLGRYYYHGLLKYTNLLAGNSSSGILETPFYKIPTVDIGNRQKNRFHCGNVLTVNEFDTNNIFIAFMKALENQEFIEKCNYVVNPYGDGEASKKIVKILSEIDNSDKLLIKNMTY